MVTLVSHIWKPSTARMIEVPADAGHALVWPSKGPCDVLDYLLDLAPALVGNVADPIEGADISVEPSQVGDLSVDNIVADGQWLAVWLSGGEVGVTYQVTVRVAFASARVIERTVTLAVIATAPIAPPSPPIDPPAPPVVIPPAPPVVTTPVAAGGDAGHGAGVSVVTSAVVP